ncbi:MAG TPA: hypothetical protein IAC36_02445 [Candidatus Aphodomonas merdavium]|nr:hypothetical protein [Candidatus Aphodomonas merdavium]
MPSVTTHGVVVRLVNYRDHDRMLTIPSPQLAASELFVSGEFALFQSREHALLTSCQIDDTFYPLRLVPYRLTCASYMAPLCATAAQPGQEAASCMRCCCVFTWPTIPRPIPWRP